MRNLCERVDVGIEAPRSSCAKRPTPGLVERVRQVLLLEVDLPQVADRLWVRRHGGSLVGVSRPIMPVT